MEMNLSKPYEIFENIGNVNCKTEFIKTWTSVHDFNQGLKRPCCKSMGSKNSTVLFELFWGGTFKFFKGFPKGKHHIDENINI